MKKRNMLLVIVSLMLIQASWVWAADKLTFYVVTHGGIEDPFWKVVVKGATDASEQFGVDVVHLSPRKSSIPELVLLAEAAIAANPDGIAITMTDVNALDAPLKKAVQQGIPIVAINVPDPRPADEKIPYLAYIGADNYKVGIEAGRRLLKEFGATKPQRGVVLVHIKDHKGLEARARGFLEVLLEQGIAADKLVGTPNEIENYQLLEAYLSEHPETDVIFATGPLAVHPTLMLLEDKQLVNTVKLAGVDLSPTIIQAIKDGKMLFTIEQQQYLQGYLAIEFLKLYTQYGLIPHDDILTGPALVDQKNAALVEEMVSKNYR